MKIIKEEIKDGFKIITYDNGTVLTELISEPITEEVEFERLEPRAEEILQAEILKSQILLEEKLEEQELILAEFLLNSMKGV